jgi:CRP-like cAMP-binding protein
MINTNRSSGSPATAVRRDRCLTSTGRGAHHVGRPAGSAIEPPGLTANGPTLVLGFTVAMATYRNHMLSALPADELAVLTPHLERIPLPRRMVAYDPLQPIAYAYFVETGVISVLSVMRDRTAIETATIGCEGVIGLPLFHGVESVAEQAFVQVPGEAYRMPAAPFRELSQQLPTLSRLLNRYAVCVFTLAAQSSGCNRVHTMEQRMARWLLMVHDRMPDDTFELTQDFLSQMLGVRRATVSETASQLQQAGLITYTRGRVTVMDRESLERAACECYGIIESTFARLLELRARPNVLQGMTFSVDGKSIAADGGSGDPEEMGGLRRASSGAREA